MWINYFNALFSFKFGLGCVRISVCLWVCVPHGRKVNYGSSVIGPQKSKSSMNSKIQINDKIDLRGSCNAAKFRSLEALKNVLSLWHPTLSCHVRCFVHDFTT